MQEEEEEGKSEERKEKRKAEKGRVMEAFSSVVSSAEGFNCTNYFVRPVEID